MDYVPQWLKKAEPLHTNCLPHRLLLKGETCCLHSPCFLRQLCAHTQVGFPEWPRQQKDLSMQDQFPQHPASDLGPCKHAGSDTWPSGQGEQWGLTCSVWVLPFKLSIMFFSLSQSTEEARFIHTGLVRTKILLASYLQRPEVDAWTRTGH